MGHLNWPAVVAESSADSLVVSPSSLPSAAAAAAERSASSTSSSSSSSTSDSTWSASEVLWCSAPPISSADLHWNNYLHSIQQIVWHRGWHLARRDTGTDTHGNYCAIPCTSGGYTLYTEAFFTTAKTFPSEFARLPFSSASDSHLTLWQWRYIKSFL